MLYRQLGDTDLRVSAVGLGTWAMGNDYWGTVDDNQCIDAIRAALDHGVNFIDTAPPYGQGHAEELVGRAIKDRKDKAVIATKVGVRHEGDNFVVDLAPDFIRQEVDRSLQRLGVDTIDVYFVHWPDPRTPLEASLEALAEIKEQGKFRHLGLSNFAVRQIDNARSLGRIDCVQPHYSLLKRDIERRMVPYCLDHHLGLVTYGTLAGGILTGKYTEIPRFTEKDKRSQFYNFFHEPVWSNVQSFLDVIKPIAQRYHRPLAQLAINWAMYQPGVVTALVGAKNPEQAISNAQAGEWELHDEDLDMIDTACEQYLRTAAQTGVHQTR